MILCQAPISTSKVGYIHILHRYIFCTCTCELKETWLSCIFHFLIILEKFFTIFFYLSVLGIRIRIGSGFKSVPGSGSGFGIWIRIQIGLCMYSDERERIPQLFICRYGTRTYVCKLYSYLCTGTLWAVYVF